MSDVEWRDIPSHPGYQASSHGQIRSLDRMVNCGRGRQRMVPGKILPQGAKKDGHPRVNLGHRYSRGVACLVLEAFCKPRQDGMFAHHRDGDRRNNHIDNLEWASRRGKRLFLREYEVREIRSRVGGGESTAQLAKELGVNSKTVWDVANRKTWAWLQ